MAGKLGIIVDFEVKEGMLDEFMPLMELNARNSVNNEPGCRQFDILKVDGEANRYILYEIYDDNAAFEAHRATPHLAAFLEKARPLMQNQKYTRVTRTATNAKR